MPKAHQILITFDGQTINVQATSKDMLLCYGLLETAKDILREQANAPAEEQPRIQPVGALPPGLLKP